MALSEPGSCGKALSFWLAARVQMADFSTSIPNPSNTEMVRRRCIGGASLKELSKHWAGPLLVLAICWFFFFQELSDEWRINPQYSYGYVVPLLGLALLWRRWPERPTVTRASSASVVFAAALCFLLLLPVRVCFQANPEWRLLYWLHGFLAIGLSFCLLHFAGGRSWLRFFAPPIAFMLIAVPWPMGLEQWTIQSLMRLTAALTVECAGWFGIPCVQHGNVIETVAGLVGIDEACSGVRSLQSALMLSLFLGEMHRLTMLRRLALVGASLLFDLIANLTRTSFLVWAAANKGLTQMEAWHDAAGLLVMIVVLPGLLALAQLLKSKIRPAKTLPAQKPFALRLVPGWVAVAALLWIVSGEMISELWYRVHETKLVPTVRWSAAWPTQSLHFTSTALPQKALSILRCSNSEAAAWEDTAGNKWSGFLLRWKPGKNSAQLAKGHRPDTCFPAAGARLLQDYGPVRVPARTFELPFRHETFETDDKTVHVFYCLWPDRVASNEKTLLEDGSQWSRLKAVFAGKRHLGQQVLELVLAGPESQAEALQALQNTLPSLIQLNSAN